MRWAFMSLMPPRASKSSNKKCAASCCRSLDGCARRAYWERRSGLRNYKRRPPLSHYRTALPGLDYSELQGKLIVIEGPDAVGRSTQIRRLKPWLEEFGHAVLDTGMARSAL